MGVRYLPDGKTLVIHAYRRPDGSKTDKSRVVHGRDKRLIARTMLELAESVDGSLTVTTYKALSERYRKERGDGGEPWRFERLEEELGRRRVDRKFAYHYARFLGTLAGLGVNTQSHFKSILQRVLNFGYRQGMIDEIPIRDWGIRFSFRDRVWTPDERVRIYNAIDALGYVGWLGWLVRFLEARPVRWQSDARSLTVDHLVHLGPVAARLGPHLRFQPRKTERRKPRPTYVPLLDRRTGEPFDEELYEHLCRQKGFLFPDQVGRQLTRDARDAWRAVCAKAEVEDLYLHDLKHVAVTRMLRDEQWTRQEMRELGMQYSDKGLDVYYHEDAEAVLMAVRRRIRDARCGGNVEPRAAVNAVSACPQHGSNVRPQV